MDPASQQQHSRRYLLTLALGAVGVVYGDIGTSPLYAFRECFNPEHHMRPTPDAILGILSLIVWSLVIVISAKYLGLVMRADNRGEGGILALMSLVRPRGGGRSFPRRALIALGLFGAALLYGDGMITPAITVLSALEGLNVVTPVFEPFIIPMTVVIIFSLFFVQKWGTAKVGAMFGPIMLIWFGAIAVLGLYHVLRNPGVLAAVNPLHAIRFFQTHGVAGFLVLGAVFLVVTGGEALYADMGHFGARPIRYAWFTCVFPSLLMNYFGQGAFLLQHPEGTTNPFFLMAPKWSLYPLVILSTIASVIASQAVISGAFSLTRQAVQLGYLPRMRIRHTSVREIGQIYIPSVNWLLMICAIGLVLAFRHSSNLAAAYGVAVTATMGITTLLMAVVEREKWRWRLAAIVGLAIPMIAIDLAFFGANIVKIWDGGWFPLVVGATVFLLMTTWFVGRRILTQRLQESAMTAEQFVDELTHGKLPRVPGTAIFLSRQRQGVPTTLLHNIKHNKVVHKRVVFLTIDVEETSHLSEEERFEWQELGNGVYRLLIRYGYMEEPDLPETLAKAQGPVTFEPMSTSYFLGRETLIPTKHPGMAVWREHLFAWMNRNASSAATFFSLPANQVIELGAQVEL